MGAKDRAITLARLRMSVLLEVAVSQFRLGLERPAPVGAGFLFLAQRLQRDTQIEQRLGKFRRRVERFPIEADGPGVLPRFLEQQRGVVAQVARAMPLVSHLARSPQ